MPSITGMAGIGFTVFGLMAKIKVAIEVFLWFIDFKLDQKNLIQQAGCYTDFDLNNSNNLEWDYINYVFTFYYEE